MAVMMEAVRTADTLHVVTTHVLIAFENLKS
jgi:hypothetical protein